MFEANSPIFRVGFHIVFFVSQVLAIYLLLRGHNLPGGGFIGGLVCALALVVLSFDVGVARVKRLLRVDPLLIAILGLCLAVLSTLVGPLVGDAFMQHYNGHLDILGGLPIGTPLLFDAGVFLVVVGVFTKGLFTLTEAAAGRDPFDGVDPRRYVRKEDDHGPA
jgi:multisubunit Na+/H+ antiporter MnhB subunit